MIIHFLRHRLPKPVAHSPSNCKYKANRSRRFRASPETFLILLGGYFCLRELGTFPAAWTDDSLFMIVARQVAEGRGYMIPLLGNEWAYPYFLNVGPPLILPVALFIKFFGFSVAIARVPMVIYVALTSIVLYRFTSRMAGRSAACWTTALLLSLSTFINTGKTVMGEIPGFFFLILGLLLLTKINRSRKDDICIGLCFGLSVLTKLTYGLIYPALGLAWIAAILKRDGREWRSLMVIGVVAVAVFAPWRLLEMSHATGLSSDFAFLFSSGEGEGFQILHGNVNLLLRPQYLYYGAMLLLGGCGLWMKRKKISRSVWIIITTLITCLTLYFLSSFGWYRHLLPAHLLLIPFVVMAVQRSFPKKAVMALLLFFVLGQGYWQYDHRGSSRSTAAAEAATYVEENLQETDVIIQIAPLFVRLESNPHWLFLTNPTLTSRLPAERVRSPLEEQDCPYVIRGLLPEDGDDVKVIGRKYALIPPPKEKCRMQN